MGLVEALLEHASAKSVSIFLIFAYVLWTVLARINEYRSIKRLGNHGPAVPSYMPWGESTLVLLFLNHWRREANFKQGSTSWPRESALQWRKRT